MQSIGETLGAVAAALAQLGDHLDESRGPGPGLRGAGMIGQGRTPQPDWAALREEYSRGGLSESDLTADPFEMFDRWLLDAVTAGLPEPNAMVLATASTTAVPSCRMVLLKGVTDAGFVFFTNQRSRKGIELGANPACALLFPWHQLERQVRVDGIAGQLPREEVEVYFASRPRGRPDSAPGRRTSPRTRGRPGRAGAGVRRRRGSVRGRRDPSAARGVGRLSRRPRGVRVLAGPAQPDARPPRLPPYRRGWDTARLAP